MKSLFQPTADNPIADWLIFAVFLVLICACIGGFIIWLKTAKGNRSKRKRKHRYHRASNPTLAQTGGLPPKRDTNLPPPGP